MNINEMKLVEGHVLTAEPGDVVVLSTPQHISRELADALREQLGQLFGPGIKVAVLDGGMKLSLLRGLTAEQADEVTGK